MNELGFFLIAFFVLLPLAIIIANAGLKRRIGFGWALFLGLFLSPIVSFVAVLFSEKIEPDEDGDIEKNWGCTGPIITVIILAVSIAVIIRLIVIDKMVY